MSLVPAEMERVLRERGPVIDVAGMKALYAPLLEQQSHDAVDCSLDIAYGDDVRHRLDIYSTAAPAQHLRPILMFVHGGGFIRGDKRERANLAYAFAQQGYIVVLPNYRLGTTHRWPAGAEDVASALEWLGTRAQDFGGDAARIVLAGESAGAAHVAASTLISRLNAPTVRPIGVALISGVYNARLEGLAREQFGIATPDPRNEAYFGSDRAAWDAMSTVELIDAEPFPLLISFAEMDPLQMQVQAGELFARLVSRHRFQPSLQVIRGHNHLSQLYSIGTRDRSLLEPLSTWMQQLTGTPHSESIN